MLDFILIIVGCVVCLIPGRCRDCLFVVGSFSISVMLTFLLDIDNLGNWWHIIHALIITYAALNVRITAIAVLYIFSLLANTALYTETYLYTINPGAYDFVYTWYSPIIAGIFLLQVAICHGARNRDFYNSSNSIVHNNTHGGTL